MSGPPRLTLTVEEQTVVARYEGEDANGPVSEDREGPFDLDDLKREMVDLLVAWLREEQLRPAGAQLLGKILYRAVFSPEIEEFFHERSADFHRAGQGARLPVQLGMGEDLIGYPWEFLYGPVAPDTIPIFLATGDKFVLSRYAPGGEDWGEPPAALKTLVITSLPEDILECPPGDPGAYDPLVTNIRRASSIELVDPVLQNSTKDDVEAALRDHAPDVVHYIGYGDRVNTDRGLEGAIALCEADARKCKWIPYSELVDSFQRAPQRPRLVYLHLCPLPAPAGGLVGRASFTQLAFQLSRIPIQAVLGMQYPLAIDQDVTQGFTETFYDRIAEQGLVGAAIQAGRSSAYNKSAGNDHRGIWNIGKPVLYMSAERVMTTAVSGQQSGSTLTTSDTTERQRRVGERNGDSPQPSEGDRLSIPQRGDESEPRRTLPQRALEGWDLG